LNERKASSQDSMEVVSIHFQAFPGHGSRIIASHETEKMETYARLFKAIDVAELFPEYAAIASHPSTSAKLFTWFGDTMALFRGWYAFADEQYGRSISIWPSWRNTARFRRLINRVQRAILNFFVTQAEFFV
jgi:hypothetical protein